MQCNKYVAMYARKTRPALKERQRERKRDDTHVIITNRHENTDAYTNTQHYPFSGFKTLSTVD